MRAYEYGHIKNKKSKGIWSGEYQNWVLIRNDGTQRQRNDIFKVLKEKKKLSTEHYISNKLSFKNKDEIKAFPDK
jgi:hypothetical protein